MKYLPNRIILIIAFGFLVVNISFLFAQDKSEFMSDKDAIRYLFTIREQNTKIIEEIYSIETSLHEISEQSSAAKAKVSLLMMNVSQLENQRKQNDTKPSIGSQSEIDEINAKYESAVHDLEEAVKHSESRETEFKNTLSELYKRKSKLQENDKL